MADDVVQCDACEEEVPEVHECQTCQESFCLACANTHIEDEPDHVIDLDVDETTDEDDDDVEGVFDDDEDDDDSD